MYRLEAAVLANQPDVALESVRLICNEALRVSESSNASERPLFTAYLKRCVQVVTELNGRPQVDQRQIRSMDQLLAHTLSVYSTL